jgi:hypothetical protein
MKQAVYFRFHRSFSRFAQQANSVAHASLEEQARLGPPNPIELKRDCGGTEKA